MPALARRPSCARHLGGRPTPGHAGVNAGGEGECVHAYLLPAGRNGRALAMDAAATLFHGAVSCRPLPLDVRCLTRTRPSTPATQQTDTAATKQDAATRPCCCGGGGDERTATTGAAGRALLLEQQQRRRDVGSRSATTAAARGVGRGLSRGRRGHHHAQPASGPERAEPAHGAGAGRRAAGVGGGPQGTYVCT